MTTTINGVLIFEGPVYRGNSLKTIFTRGRSEKDINLPGRIDGPAKAMMNAFTGFWQNPRNPKFQNTGLLENLWRRLYNENMPAINPNVSCTLDKQIKDPHFDLRMNISIDRDRMAQAENQNFRLETIYKGSRFDFSLSYDETRLDDKNRRKFAYMIEEMVQGRFWFGANKSSGMGKCHLKLDEESGKLMDEYKDLNQQNIELNPSSNYIFIHLNITPDNPLLVSWPWGHKDEEGNLDPWVDNLVEETRAHKNIMGKVISGEAGTWDDVEQMKGGDKFKHNHMRKGRPMDLRQLKRNFPKAVQNDDTLTRFLQGYKEKAHSEIDREPHKDFREEQGTIVRGKPYDQIFNRSLTWDGEKTNWEMCIPGNTIKGAFRTKAQQLLRTLHNGRGCKEQTNSHQNRFCDDKNCPVCSLFGRQGGIASVFCSDAWLSADKGLLDDEHFSYDQTAIDPKTGESVENSKLDFLYAYGEKFSFDCTLVLEDLKIHNLGRFAFLMYLLREFEQGTVPFGGKKSLNFGHIKGRIDKIECLCSSGSELENKLKEWKAHDAGNKQAWQSYELQGARIWKNQPFTKDLQSHFSKMMGKIEVPKKPYKARAGYISHRQYSEYCGSLVCEMEALTPLHVKESGEPSFRDEEHYGYDFFSISPPKNEKKKPMNQREYAIPPSTLKGSVRSIYNLISKNSCPGCKSIDQLCDTCRLFGWVGQGNRQENALMGRLRFSFARPVEDLNFQWYGVAFGYKSKKSKVVSGTRLFPHTNETNEAVSTHGNAEAPNNLQNNITLNRFAEAGSRFQFQVDFTNLEIEELLKIGWALQMDEDMAQKVGKSKALGFGSCRIKIKEASIIDWEDRFSGFDELGEWLVNIDFGKINRSSLSNYSELKEALAYAG